LKAVNISRTFNTCQADFCLAKKSFLLFVQNIYNNLTKISIHETRKGAITFKQQHSSEKKCLLYQSAISFTVWSGLGPVNCRSVCKVNKNAHIYLVLANLQIPGATQA
jgi:hypothetical protein